MKKTLNWLLQGLIIGLGIFISIYTLNAWVSTTTNDAVDNNLKAEADNTLTLDKWNGLVQRSSGISTATNGDVTVGALAGSSNRCVYADANGVLQTKTEDCVASSSSTDEDWTNATLLGSWTRYGSPWGIPGYYKDSSGRVYLRGLVKSGSGCIFTLPTGYRPTNKLLVSTITYNNSSGRIGIDSTGCVNMDSGSSTWISLDNISFKAGQ